MNLSIFKTLKNNFINASDQNNRSTVELCITELSSGNFPKAVDLSEELIKKDVNDSVGWATKALSQAHLFDYHNNLFFLKSSLSSLEEFKTKTSLSAKEIMEVEAIFITTVLNRTLTLVTERVEEVIELRNKAMSEKAKARAASIGAAMSAYAGSNSKSDIGKILGYSVAVAGVTASSHFNSNAELLNRASKGVFGVAVANISLTIGSAITLKSKLNDLNFEVHTEASITLTNWTNTLAFLFQQVIENLLAYAEVLNTQNPFTKSFREASINLINAPEATQFIYLSKVLGIEKSIPQFKDLETHMLNLRKIEENEIKKSVKKMHLLAGGSMSLAFIFVIGFEKSEPELSKVTFNIFFILGIFAYFFFSIFPIGTAGDLKKSIKEFVDAMKNFKVTSERIIVENMIPQDNI
jgi:hypothetical protein